MPSPDARGPQGQAAALAFVRSRGRPDIELEQALDILRLLDEPE